MSKMYVHKVNGQWQIVPRPDWYYEDRTPVSDETLAENGYYEFINEGITDLNQITHTFSATPQEDWEVVDNKVTVQYVKIPKDLDQVKEAAIEKVNRDFESAARVVASDYPVTEQSTWPVQQSEVKAWRLDPNAPTPLLESISASRGIPLSELRDLAATQVDQFVTLVGHAVGQRQRFRDNIHNATTVEEVMTVLDNSQYTFPFFDDIDEEPVE